MSDLTSVTIEELDGQKRKVELRGSGQPHWGTEWKSHLQLVTTWYSGNPEATQQVLGPRLPPSSWEGSWSRVKLARSPCVVTISGQAFNVVNPHELVATMEALQAGGSRLRVTWLTQTPASTGSGVSSAAVSVVREGRLEDFSYKADRVTDYTWSAAFTWSSRGTNTQKVAATRDGGASTSQDELASTLTSFTASLEQQPSVSSAPAVLKSASFLSLGQLEALATAPLALVQSALRTIQQKVGELKQLGEIASALASEPYDIAEAVSDLARDCSSVANNFADSMDATPPETMTTKPEDAAGTMRATVAFRQQADAARDLATKAHEIVGKVALQRARRQPGRPDASTNQTLALGKLLAVHVVRAGDTPQRLSQKYYRTPDQAVEILRSNGLPWSTVLLDPGTTLIIPQLPSKRGA